MTGVIVMPPTELLSVLLNVALGAMCIGLVVRAHYTRVANVADLQILRGQARKSQGDVDAMREEYLALAQSIAQTLNQVRKDIDRNYRHTHEGHLLDRVAYQIERTGRPIDLNASAVADICAAGAGQFITNGQLLFDGALDLAWHLHGQARSNANHFYEVVRESCGNTDRAAWLAKSLALYLQICDGDKYRAIDSLEAVLLNWRHYDLDLALAQVFSSVKD